MWRPKIWGQARNSPSGLPRLKKLSKEEIDKMVKDAEKFAAEDSRHKEEVELKNQADTLVYSTEKSPERIGR